MSQLAERDRQSGQPRREPILECIDLGFERSATGCGAGVVLDSIDARVSVGEVALLTGPTGAGKSTLLHLFAGLLSPSRGEVRAMGEPVSRWAAVHRDRWRRNVGISFQSAFFLPELNVLENVAIPLMPLGLALDEMLRRAGTALDRMHLACLADRTLAELSFGQRQRVSVARALVTGAPILLLDEPSAHQDDPSVEVLVAALQGERDRGAAIIVASHDPRLRHRQETDCHWHLADGRLSKVE